MNTKQWYNMPVGFITPTSFLRGAIISFGGSVCLYVSMYRGSSNDTATGYGTNGSPTAFQNDHGRSTTRFTLSSHARSCSAAQSTLSHGPVHAPPTFTHTSSPRSSQSIKATPPAYPSRLMPRFMAASSMRWLNAASPVMGLTVSSRASKNMPPIVPQDERQGKFPSSGNLMLKTLVIRWDGTPIIEGN